MIQKFIQFILAIAILGCGVLGAGYLLFSRSKSRRLERPPDVTLVEIIKTEFHNANLTIPAMGTVRSAAEITLFPEVGGRIIEVATDLVPGGRVRANQVIARIDKRDYELAVEQQAAQVEQRRAQVVQQRTLIEQKNTQIERALFDITVEEGRQVVAKREWKLIGKGRTASKASRNLALRQPHRVNAKAALAGAKAGLAGAEAALAGAEAALAGAKSGLARAQLNVKRTELIAPFNAVVQEEFVDPGQVVTPQSRIARLVGTDRFWVQASVPLDRLRRIALPDDQGEGGARAQVVLDVGNGEPATWQGRVVRLLSDLDPVGRMARVLVTVDAPLARKMPLLIGAYCRVKIQGGKLKKVVRVPRKALHDGDRVWIMNDKGRLEVRPVKVAWRLKEAVLVAQGLSPGERLVTSRIPTPIPGMRLRVEKKRAKPQDTSRSQSGVEVRK